jgi:hypothetical protein
MEQLELQTIVSNDCTQETSMTNKSFERKQAVEANHQYNYRIKELTDQYFSTLPVEQRAKRNSWAGAAEYVSQQPEGMQGRDQPWKPQGLARVYRLAEMWMRRAASPQMVTPERRRIYRLISVLLQEKFSWPQIAEELNRKGWFWKATGRPVAPFTNKSANDFYRHHQGLWPSRPRKNSQIQLELLSRTMPATAEPRAKAPVVEDRSGQTTSPVPPAALPVKQPKSVRKAVAVPLNVDADNSNVSVFKRRYGDTSIKVVVRDLDGIIEVVVRYSGKSGADATSRVAGLVQQLQGFDYRD